MRWVFTEASVDVSYGLVHGHVDEASAQAVMGEDEQHRLQELIESVQSLDTTQPRHEDDDPRQDSQRDFLRLSYCALLEKVQDEGDGAAVQANEEVDARQRDIGRAGNPEDVRHGVHHGGHRPPAKRVPNTNKDAGLIFNLHHKIDINCTYMFSLVRRNPNIAKTHP